MKKYNLIILAGGEDEHWCKYYGYKKKAFLPILGKPMLGWVIDAFRKSHYIDNIVVVGPKELNQLDSMRYVRKHLCESTSFIHNLILALLYVKSSIYKFSGNHQGYLISFCDAVFLTTGIINATLENISKFNADLVLHYVQKETIARRGYPIENRSYLQISGKDYTGANIYYVRRISKLLRILNDLKLLRQYRKEPRKILNYIGCENADITAVEAVISKMIAGNVKIFVSPFAEMGVDVDKTADYELAGEELLKLQRETARLKNAGYFGASLEADSIDAEIQRFDSSENFWDRKERQ